MNPYLKDNRLQDVIAAITAMSAYKFYKLDFVGWSHRISATPDRASHWEAVFREHPEFFRLNYDRTAASLVWRRQFPRNYAVDEIQEVAADHHILGTSYDPISRRPLDATELASLIQVAISLHTAAVERGRDRRWWVWAGPTVLGFAGAVLGGYLSSG